MKCLHLMLPLKYEKPESLSFLILTDGGIIKVMENFKAYAWYIFAILFLKFKKKHFGK